MMRSYNQLSRAERLVLSLAPGEMPMSWRSAAQNNASQHGAARRSWRGLVAAVAVSLFGMAWVLTLDVFTVPAGEPGAVFFPSGASEAQAFAAIVAAGGLPIRATSSVFSDAVVWIAAADDPAFFSTITHDGALIVVNPLAFNGCFLRSDT
jgi:hypothetical protein